MSVANLKKNLFLFSALSILSFFLLGFIYPNIQTTFGLDGSGTIVVDVGIDSKLVGLIEQEIGQGLWQVVEQNLPENLKLQTYQKDKISHYKTELKFADTGKLIYQNPKTEKIMKWPVRLRIEDNLFYVNYYFEQPINLRYERYLPESIPPQVEKILKRTSLVYQVALPGTIVKTNAMWRKGSYASWQLNLKRETTLKAKSQLIRWRLVLLVGVLILIIMGVIGMWATKYKALKEQAAEATDS